ncbi:hypothetical protein [Streptomyces sp. NPDC012825]|uniref:hypothetical protein n=1 Tax=Streptomyces sp. NPDC012825 TaxID=3364851 RepID=UPI0036760075
MLSSGSKKRPIWPFVAAGSVLGVLLLAAGGLWAFGVYSMSEPSRSLLIGVRIEGARVTVKAPTCPTDTVARVEVFDGESTKPLWQAREPRTSEGRSGAVTLWADDEFLKPGPGAQPEKLPRSLDVLFTYAGTGDGTGDVVDVAQVVSAEIPEGWYWTKDGPKTAQEIDKQLKCTQGKTTAS